MTYTLSYLYHDLCVFSFMFYLFVLFETSARVRELIAHGAHRDVRGIWGDSSACIKGVCTYGTSLLPFSFLSLLSLHLMWIHSRRARRTGSPQPALALPAPAAVHAPCVAAVHAGPTAPRVCDVRPAYHTEKLATPSHTRVCISLAPWYAISGVSILQLISSIY